MPRKRSATRSSSGELLVGRVPLAARALVQPLGERLGEAVGERLDDDRRVVVVLGLVPGGELVGAVDRRPRTRRCGRRSARRSRRGSGSAGRRRGRPAGGGSRSACRRPTTTSSPSALRRPEAVDAARAAAGRSATISSSTRQRVVVELARRRLVEDRRELALQVPGVEEELPVDVRHERRQLARRRRACR